MKYIDAEKLLAVLERQNTNKKIIQPLIRIIDSLQQEQEEEPVGKTCKTCGFYENNCPFIRGKFIPYPNKVCKDYTFSTLKAEQEPVSEDLEEAKEEYLRKARRTPGHEWMTQDIEEAFKAGAEWQARQLLKSSPLPEDTVIFQKGVEEGRRLEREDALSIADIEKLHTFLYAVKNNKTGAFTFTRLSDEQYEEVLRRFNKTREQ